MTVALVPLVLATHNAHKVIELRQILGTQLDGIDLMAYDGPEPVEDGTSFEANALIKARAASAHTGFAAIADDSGIAVAALGGAPGIHSARYAGSRDDAENVRLLLTNLQSADDRSAEFLCAAALVLPDGREFVELARWPGSVLLEPVGGGGFGYDPVFKPTGYSVSAAELHPEEKNTISHRGQAFDALMPIVRASLLGLHT
ncbi:RdgB/HAM1 family non-canonical purine NTP pyrophosphatase [Frigoribacterium sp. CG_9.8]|uniref:RdgB/HAM1 family non-canonical purine NTP pyrophosphatase n=1 Tax=Frigoribacterium sp. CG_9.8 TaxID=2787733 RepID=UPI0018CAFB88|nr:RdgB/HAM1 family non-canonical purine NTP pyrophosphatase [Frigoribacterium sp. CG_9.8]MBG6107556.1 XTP/dITP diphosphohydrolase [Frigoribacterium sp. CG_9.8]